MRNPERIEPILDRIRQVWNKHPDLRILQLLVNTLEDDSMVYYVEDDDLFRRLGEAYHIGGTQPWKKTMSRFYHLLMK